MTPNRPSGSHGDGCMYKLGHSLRVFTILRERERERERENVCVRRGV